MQFYNYREAFERESGSLHFNCVSAGTHLGFHAVLNPHHKSFVALAIFTKKQRVVGRTFTESYALLLSHQRSIDGWSASASCGFRCWRSWPRRSPSHRKPWRLMRKPCDICGVVCIATALYLGCLGSTSLINTCARRRRFWKPTLKCQPEHRRWLHWRGTSACRRRFRRTRTRLGWRLCWR